MSVSRTLSVLPTLPERGYTPISGYIWALDHLYGVIGRKYACANRTPLIRLVRAKSEYCQTEESPRLRKFKMIHYVRIIVVRINGSLLNEGTTWEVRGASLVCVYAERTVRLCSRLCTRTPQRSPRRPSSALF
ncbi:hypothetical protein VTO73DRAFT_4753 [Trametes versicolor]